MTTNPISNFNTHSGMGVQNNVQAPVENVTEPSQVTTIQGASATAASTATQSSSQSSSSNTETMAQQIRESMRSYFLQPDSDDPLNQDSSGSS